MSDAFAEIHQERQAARAALDEAERLMRDGSRDAKAFARAKREREAAVAELERLDWAEQAELARQEASARQAKADRLREVQARAVEAHAAASALQADLTAVAAKLCEITKSLQAAQEVVTVGVNHETFALRDRTIPRPTVEARVAVDKDAAVLALRAAKELCRLAGMHPAAADQQAAQRRL